jgi:hypothetical protein
MRVEKQPEKAQPGFRSRNTGDQDVFPGVFLFPLPFYPSNENSSVFTFDDASTV